MMNPIFLFHVVCAYARVPPILDPKGLGLRVLVRYRVAEREQQRICRYVYIPVC
jgi:hypothetical protein